MLKLLLTSLLALLSTTAVAQIDTIPHVLQRTAFPGQISQVAYRHADSILILSTNKIFLFTDGGYSFIETDSLNGAADVIALTNFGPFIRINKSSASVIEQSSDAGISWQPTASLQHARGIDNVSTNGKRFSFNDLLQDRDFVTSNFGASWDTVGYNASTNLHPTAQAWYDADHGIEFRVGRSLIITSNGGQIWDTLFKVGDTGQYTNGILNLSQSLQYPSPGVLVITGFANSGSYLSLDTGHTWSFSHSVESNIAVLGNSNWVAFSQSGSTQPNTLVHSSDRGKSWQVINYTCPNVAGPMTFSDSLNGVMLGSSAIAGSAITVGAKTTDGGRTWECLDTTIYMMGAGDHINTQNILPDRTASNTYFALAIAYNRIYLCRSLDRGESWSLLFPIPWSPIEGYSSPLLFGKRFFFPYSGSIRWTSDFGATYHEKDFPVAFQTEGGFVINSFDGTVWAGNPGTLLISNDSGDTWNNLTEQLPDYNADSNYSYQYQIVDRLTGFVKLGDTVFRTIDGGETWRRDSVMPDNIIDSRNWIVLAKHEKTTDAGATWKVFNKPPTAYGAFFAVDTKRWYYFGSYTSNAGVSWQPIPRWMSGLTAVDSATAFSANAPPLLRLDLPFKGVAEDVKRSVTPTILAAVSPNPAGDKVEITFSLEQQGQVTMAILNVMGSSVYSKCLGSFCIGSHSVALSLANLPSGIYYARISNGDESQMVKIAKE